MVRYRKRQLSFALALAVAVGGAAGAQSVDPMEATSDARQAVVSPLTIVTVTTGDMLRTRRFYQGAMGMTAVEQRLTGAEARALARHWGFTGLETLDVVIFSRPGLPEAAMVRAVAVPPGTPPARQGYDAEYVGALGMGVPVHDLAQRDEVVRAFGFQSQVGVTSMAFPRADKTTYTVGEIHYLAPDDVLVLGVDRADLRPVGPIDPAVDIGGPSYVSAIISDAATSAPFFQSVLGYEKRREFVFQSKGAQGGLRLPVKTDVLFQQWFAPGARTGYLVIMDLLNAGKTSSAPLGPRSRGLAMWSFSTENLAEVERRIGAVKAKVLSPAQTVTLPGVGRARALVVAAPDGLPIEIYQLLRT